MAHYSVYYSLFFVFAIILSFPITSETESYLGDTAKKSLMFFTNSGSLAQVSAISLVSLSLYIVRLFFFGTFKYQSNLIMACTSGYYMSVRLF